MKELLRDAADLPPKEIKPPKAPARAPAEMNNPTRFAISFFLYC